MSLMDVPKAKLKIFYMIQPFDFEVSLHSWLVWLTVCRPWYCNLITVKIGKIFAARFGRFFRNQCCLQIAQILDIDGTEVPHF